MVVVALVVLVVLVVALVGWVVASSRTPRG
jgi:hypothetical protein